MSGDRARAELAASLLVEGVSLRAAGRELGIAGERVRQIIAAHPDLEEAVQASRDRRAAEAAEAREADARERAERLLAARAAARPAREATPTAALERVAREFLDERGEPAASSVDFRSWLEERHPDGPSAQTFIDRLGPSWGDLCERLGYQAVGGRGLGKDAAECLKAVRRVQRSTGGPPTVAEYERLKRPGDPARKTVAARIGQGRWSNVVALLLEEAAVMAPRTYGPISVHPAEDCEVCRELGTWDACEDSIEWIEAHREAGMVPDPLMSGVNIIPEAGR